ncbi:Hypothetical protein SCF082_LOCUS38632, partial [Durusdinium trenchii]
HPRFLWMTGLPRVVCITGWSGAGKTFAGSYLERTHGWSHLDGDRLLHQSDEQSQRLKEGLLKSFYQYWFKNLPAPPELWQPYCDELARQCASQPSPLALTFSVYRKEMRDYFRQVLPGITFLRLDCDPEVVISGSLQRLENYLSNTKKTVEDWRHEKQFHETYGPYTFENYKKMQMAEYLSGLEPFTVEELDAMVCDLGPGCRGPEALLAVARALGLEPKEPDLDALKEREKERLADLARVHSK